MRVRYLAVAAIFVAALVVSGPVLAANTPINGFLNGGFQCGSCASTTTFDTLGTGSTAMTGWTVTSGSVDWINGYWLSDPAASTTNSLDMNGNGPGTIQQNFSTTAGATYSVSFYLSGNPDGAPTTKILDVTASGNPLIQYPFDVTAKITHSTMGWVSRSYTFTATTDSTTLT
ncbi:MAG: choice-of-anchor C family protein, partial [Candidatus Dormiibacterota bacterium]